MARRAPALIALIAGTALSATLLGLLRHRQAEVFEEEVHEAARERVEILRSQMLRSMEVLHGIAALYGARGEVSREEFRAFVASALARQPELQALAWDPRVRRDERAHWEGRAQAEGFADFHFTEAAAAENKAAAKDREEYFPVFFLEPADRNADAFGFDVGAESHRRAALELARDSGRTTATAPIRLAQEKESQRGFLVFESTAAHPARSRSAEPASRALRSRCSGSVI